MQAAGATDPSLSRFLQTRDEREASRHLEALLSEIEPTLRAVIRRRWGSVAHASSQDRQQSEDILSDVLYQLVARLGELRSHGQAPEGTNGTAATASIGNFRAFAAVTASRVCDAYVREKYPNRNRLRRRLEYLVGEQSPVRGFALWTTSDGDRLAGFGVWKERGKRANASTAYRRLLENPAKFLAESFPNDDLSRIEPPELLAAVFDRVGTPIQFDDLIGIFARIWGVTDDPQSSLEEQDQDSGDGPRSESIEASLLRHEYLQHLWNEIRQLPARQAAALLLNLRDPRGNGIIALLPITRTASMSEIAAAMGMEREELVRVWNGLPMDDLKIAEVLGCTRQQVINLRRSARERLTRKMAALSL